MNIYVGNLAYTMNEDELRDLFADFGEVSQANLIIDKMSGRSKGFGFVEMPNDDEANNAIEALNDQNVAGRKIKVNQARPRGQRPERSGGDYRSDRRPPPRM